MCRPSVLCIQCKQNETPLKDNEEDSALQSLLCTESMWQSDEDEENAPHSDNDNEEPQDFMTR